MIHRDKCERNVTAWDGGTSTHMDAEDVGVCGGCSPGLVRQRPLVQRWLDSTLVNPGFK